MTIQEIIKQEEEAIKAKQYVAEAENKKRCEMLSKFALKIFDFLEIINNDPHFLFSDQPYESTEYYEPLFKKLPGFEFYKAEALEELAKRPYHKLRLRPLSYGSEPLYLEFGTTFDYKMVVKISTPRNFDNPTEYKDTEEVFRYLTRMFLNNRKALE